MSLFGSPRRPEFDQYTIKFTIGAIALLLPVIEMVLTKYSITSISQSFWIDDGLWPRSIFVGLLFSISSLLLSYNGNEVLEMWLGKLASLCAIGIAMFPCGCGFPSREIVPYVHLTSAGMLFAILGVFCGIFWRHAKQKGHREARRRMMIYSVCCLGMVATIGLFIKYAMTSTESLVLYGETVGLVSFGVSWLTASRVLPFLTHPSERKQLFVRT